GLPSDMDVFFYFYWTLGQFPVGIRGGDYAVGPTREDAQELVKQHGPDLVMAFNTPANSTRDGDWGRMFLYVPSVLMTGDPRIATVRPANEIVWIIALLALFYAMALNGHVVLG